MNYTRVRNAFLLALCLALGSNLALAADIWVSPRGSDADAGTREKPLASLQMALRKARDLRRTNDPSIAGGIRIVMLGGKYFIDDTIFIRPEDSGTAGSPTSIEAFNAEPVIVSGGRRIADWKKAGKVDGLPAAAAGKIYVADVPAFANGEAEFRQLWLNDKKATRARTENFPSMKRILSWNHQDETCTIPAPAAKNLKGGDGLEMFIHQWWAIANLRVKEIRYMGDSARLSFFQPESRVQSQHPWPAPWISARTGNSAFYLSNALAFLDEPGEWFLDKQARKLYYWPRKGEDMGTAEAVASGLETLMKVQGTAEHPVAWLRVKGISFMHSGWLRPSRAGHVPLQAGMYMLDAYKLKQPGTKHSAKLENQAWTGRPAAAVELAYTNNTSFMACRFEHLASSGLDYKRANDHELIEGNLFKDIGGTALQLGVFSDESVEAHLPYNPLDSREISQNINVRNNVITDATNEDWGCVGIGAGFVKGLLAEHNDISDVAYSGISLGWGWTAELNAMSNNVLRANKIHRYGRNMYDVAAIYTLSAQPGSVIEENYIDSIYVAPYSHDHHHWFYLYCDEGSAYFNVRNNWTPEAKFLQNANGPENVWKNNGPQVDLRIRNSAGLEAPYRAMLSEIGRPEGIINSVYRHPEADHPAAILFEGATQPDLEAIRYACRQFGIAETSVYTLGNKVAVYDDFLKDAAKIGKKLSDKYPDLKVSVLSGEPEIYEMSGHAQSPEWLNLLFVGKMGDFKGLKNPAIQRALLFKNSGQDVLVISVDKQKPAAAAAIRAQMKAAKMEEFNFTRSL